MLRPHVDAAPDDDETEVGKLSPFLFHLQSHVLQQQSLPLDAPADECFAVKKKRKEQNKTKEDDEGDCN